MSARIQLFYNYYNKTVHYNFYTTVSLRRELWTPSQLVLKFYKIFKQSFWDPFEWLHVAGRAWQKVHILFPRKDTVMKLTSPFLVTLQIPLTQRALKGLFKGTWALDGHSQHLGTRALKGHSNHLRTWRALGHSRHARHFI